MAGGLEISTTEAQKFITEYFNNFPTVKDFIEKAINTVKTKKFVQTITKRRRRFDNYNRLPVPKGKVYEEMTDAEKTKLYRERDKNNKAIERMGVNAVIQGSAADIMKIAIRNIHKKLEGLDSHILLQIHDEILLEVPIESANEIMAIVKYEMEHAVTLP